MRDEIDRLNGQVFQLHRQGRYAEALSLARRACELARQHLGEEHPDTTTCLNNLGYLLQAMGNRAGARPYYEQALALRRRVLGEEHPATATSLNNLGHLLQVMGDLVGARPYYEQALGICRRVLGEEHPDTAGSLNNLGYLLQAMGDLVGARPYLEQALVIRRRVLGEEHPDTAQSLNNLGYLLKEMGDRAGARPYYEQALVIRRRVLGEEHPATATSLNNLGGLLKAMGDLAGARPYLEQALVIRRRVLGQEHLDTLISLSHLGNLLQAMGDLARARPYLEQALVIRRCVLGEEHPDTALSLNNLGALLQAMGDLARARPYYEQALAVNRRVLGEEHPSTALSLNNLGYLLQVMGDLAGARPYYEQALGIRRRVLGEEHPDTALSLNNLGALLQAMGDLARARPYYEQALAIDRRVLGEEHPDTAISLNNLGTLLQAMGDLAQARPYLEQALAVNRRVLGEEHPDTALSLNSLGILHAATDRISDAFELMHRAAAIDDHMIGQVFSIGSESQRLGFLRDVQVRLEGFLSLVCCKMVSSTPAVQAAFNLVLRRKGIAAEALAAQRDAILGGRYPHLQEPLQRLNELRQQIARKTLAGQAPGEAPAAHRQQLALWDAERNRREEGLARQIPEMTLERQLRAADHRAVALALEQGVALVEFVRFDVFNFHAVRARGERNWDPARYVAFVLPGGKPDDVQMIDLGEAEPIDRLIADFRAGVTSDPGERGRDAAVCYDPEDEAPSPAPAPPRLGQELRVRIFDPLLPALGGCTRLLLAPDGDLTRLPFEVLPAGADGRLIDTYCFSYLTSGRDVLRFGAGARGRAGPPLIAADPDFDLGTTDPVAAPPAKKGFWGWLLGRRSGDTAAARTPISVSSRNLSRDFKCERADRLPGTRIEGERIAALLGVRPWLGADVLDARIKQTVSPRILHLATHGFFLCDQPHDPDADRTSPGRWENPLLRSGLLLAGYNTWRNRGTMPAEAEDGVLTAEDVTGLDLLNTELVVLSACRTGLGDIHVGEGVFGLRRAFVLAGAKTLVMSLWKVPDMQTQELMVDFYQRVLNGEPRAEALRQAQLALKARYPDPFFWGAFICQGDPAPLPT